MLWFLLSALVLALVAGWMMRRRLAPYVPQIWQRMTRDGVGGSLAIVLNVVIAIFIIVIAGLLFTGGWVAITGFLEQSAFSPLQQLLLACTVSIVAIVTFYSLIAKMVSAGNEIWRMNLVRGFALLALVIVILILRPSDFVGAFGDANVFGWIPETAGSSGSADSADALDALLPSPVELPDDLAETRRTAILAAYGKLLTDFGGPHGLAAAIAAVREWRSLTTRYASASGLELLRVEAVIAQESRGDPNATSSAGARGLMQLVDSTAIAHGASCGIANPEDDAYEPEPNICTGTTYLRAMTDLAGGDGETALGAYNWGPSNLDRAFARIPAGSPRSFWALWNATNPDTGIPLLENGGQNPHETRTYVPRVLAWELAARALDRDGRLPDTGNGAAPLVRGTTTGGGWSGGGGAVSSGGGPRAGGHSDVWYTFRSDDDYDRVIATLFADAAEEVDRLNETRGLGDRGIRAGDVLYLPPARFAHYQPTGGETLRDIADRHGMTVPELLRWSGEWSDTDVLAAARRDYTADGIAPVHTTFLIRRQ